MAKYCISDLHGELDRFEKMLETLHFCDDDTLYILGDAIDRGPEPIALLRKIMTIKNAHLLRGNHEQMLLQSRSDKTRLLNWLSSGGNVTKAQLDALSEAEREEIYAFLEQLPDYFEVSAGGTRFYLVHAQPSENPYYRLWARPHFGLDYGSYGVGTVVFGHTPTCLLQELSEGEPYRIWHGIGGFCIDCALGHEREERRLAVLRLDDLCEFYI